MGSERIVTPEHPLWPAFLSKLTRVPICRGTTENAEEALSELPDIDVQGSLMALAELGGTCDCEIEFDVASMSRVGS